MFFKSFARLVLRQGSSVCGMDALRAGDVFCVLNVQHLSLRCLANAERRWNGPASAVGSATGFRTGQATDATNWRESGPAAGVCEQVPAGEGQFCLLSGLRFSVRRRPVSTDPSGSLPVRRSEEHTSELQ